MAFESNLAPTARSVKARLDHSRALLEARVDRANAQLRAKSGGALRPFFLIPDPCWNGEMGHFLMTRLDLFPYEEWNAALLPANERTAFMLDLPCHPNGNIPAFVQAAEKLVAAAELRLQDGHRDAERTQDYARLGDVREDLRDRVRATAHFFLGQLNEAWKKHRPGRA